MSTSGPRRVRVHHLAAAKQRGERLTMLTSYDAVTAAIGALTTKGVVTATTTAKKDLLFSAY